MEFDSVWFLTFITLTFRLIRSCPEKCYCDRYSKMTCDNIVLTTKDIREFKIPSSVSELRLEKNQLREISADILRNFKNLTSLEISKNLLTTIPANTFKDFKRLKKLKLKNNKIRSISRDSFTGLGNLRSLNLENNDISLLRVGVFNRLRAIQSIRLINNKIQTIPNKVFSSRKELSDLFLTNNNITQIGDAAFQNMTMRRLGLSHNKLKSIPTTAFKGFSIFYKILLYFNPLDCRCRELMDYATSLKHLRNKLWGVCETPYELKDKDILSAHADTKCTLCDLKPCHNGGVCTGNKTWFTCRCTEKFKGKTCEISICEYKVKYVTQVVYVPGKTVIQYQKRDRDNTSAPTVVKKLGGDTEKKLMILYAMCSLEFIVILCFIALFMWKRYQDWKLLKEYDHQKRKQILEKIRSTTNKKLQESLY